VEADSDLKSAKARIEQAIGRNVLLFQRLELLLKFVVDHSRVEADHDQLLQKKREQTAEVSKSTLGLLVGKFIDEILRPTQASQTVDELEELSSSSKVRAAVGFSVAVSAEFREAKKLSLARVVEQRNQLIHHFLPAHAFDSLEGCRLTQSYLDEQYTELLPEIDFLRGLAKNLQGTKQKLVAFMATPEFRERLLHAENFPAETRRAV